jgi:hypothetical protein
MPVKVKIALCEPFRKRPDRYFSVKLKQSHCIEPTEYKKTQKLLIVNNIQGDFKFFRTFLLNAGIIDRSYNWIFSDGHLVIAGNCFSENEMGIECLWLIYALEQKAQRYGGYVHFLLGKNEIANIDGNWRYTSPQYANNPDTSKAPYVVLYDGNCELRRWIQTKNIIEKIGNVLISYVNISSEFPNLDSSLVELNSQMRKYCFRANDVHIQPLVSRILHPNEGASLSGNATPQNTTQYQVHILRHNKTNTQKKSDIAYVFGGNEGCTDNKANILLIKNNRFYIVNSEGKYERIHLAALTRNSKNSYPF